MLAVNCLWGVSDCRFFFFCRAFVDQCFRPFSAALLDDGVYKMLCKETNQYIQAVNSVVELLVFELFCC